MTTTGGPEHSVAEPATVEHLDGDDIVVVPSAPSPRKRRSRALLIGAVIVGVITAGVGIAVAMTRDDGPSTVRSSAPATPKPKTTSVPSRPRTRPTHAVAKRPPASITPQTPVSSPPAVAVPPPPPTEPLVTAPPASPTSVLQWSATPAALTIRAGGHATLTVHVVNPSDGTVTLGHPLSCPPSLRDAKGHVVGGLVCTEMAQLLTPHEQATQRYVISATDTGVSGGAVLPAGAYTASIENLFDVRVTVIADATSVR